MSRHIDFLVRHMAQPFADFAHDRFGVTPYRIATQLPIVGFGCDIGHSIYAGRAMGALDAALALICVCMSYCFHDMDREAARNNYKALPSGAINAAQHAIAWEFFFLVDLTRWLMSQHDAAALILILSVGFSLSSWIAWLLVMCRVKPRQTKRQAAPTGVVRQGGTA